MENKQVGDLHGAFEIVQKLDKAEARANASVWSGVLFSIGLLVPALGFAYFVVQRTIAVPVRRFADALKNISEGDGDLTRRLDEQGKDELAEAAKWFNRFASKVQTVIAEISGSAQSLVSASKNLSDTSSKLSDGASHTKQQTTEVATNVQGLNSNMQVIASRANGMKEAFEFVQTAVSDMRATIGDIARNAEKGASVSRDAATMAESSNEKLADLGESADAIGGVIQVISDVAEQTNLLALNATIEAARAGDAGKGFAVVATEVKELARQTALAIEDIRGRIQKMQHSTSASIQQVEQINRVIRELSQISVSIAAAVEQQSTASAQISENVMSATQLAGEIADAVSESATSTTRISENLHRVDNIVTDTAEGAGKSRVAGDALVGLANQLQKLASEFRTEAATTSA